MRKCLVNAGIFLDTLSNGPTVTVHAKISFARM